MNKEIIKHLITQKLKESREGEGTLSLRDIAKILKEVLGDDIEFLIKEIQK